MSTLARHIFRAVDEREWKEIKEKILVIFRQFGFDKVIDYKTIEDAGDDGDIEDRGDSLHFLWVTKMGIDPLMNEIRKIEGIAILSYYSCDIVTIHVTRNGEFFQIYEGIPEWYAALFTSDTPKEQPPCLAEAKAFPKIEEKPTESAKDLLDKLKPKTL
jgi:hypothetical protein